MGMRFHSQPSTSSSPRVQRQAAGKLIMMASKYCGEWGHDKVWAAAVVRQPNGQYVYHAAWGRRGAAMQHQVKYAHELPHGYDEREATSDWFWKKDREKRDKGYKDVDWTDDEYGLGQLAQWIPELGVVFVPPSEVPARDPSLPVRDEAVEAIGAHVLSFFTDDLIRHLERRGDHARLVGSLNSPYIRALDPFKPISAAEAKEALEVASVMRTMERD